jgi:hypothetical protein
MNSRVVIASILGLVAGILGTLFLSSVASQRRDAILISTYQGIEGNNAVIEKTNGALLKAYAHQANMISVMSKKQEALALDLVPWTFFFPITSNGITILVPTPRNNWKESEIDAQYKNLKELENALTCNKQ